MLPTVGSFTGSRAILYRPDRCVVTKHTLRYMMWYSLGMLSEIEGGRLRILRYKSTAVLLGASKIGKLPGSNFSVASDCGGFIANVV